MRLGQFRQPLLTADPLELDVHHNRFFVQLMAIAAQAPTPPTATGLAGLRGRPPYGYRAVTVSGEPGRLLEPDGQTAPVVLRIFQEYRSGLGMQRIAEGLTADQIPSPGARALGDAEFATAWSKGAVRSILVNPRYASTSDAFGGYEAIVPAQIAEDVRRVFAGHRVAKTATPGTRCYLLRGMVRCADCNRLMQGTWNNDAPYYRCRFPSEYANANGIEHPRNVYLRERRVVGPLTQWLLDQAMPKRLVETARVLGTPSPSSAMVESVCARLRALRGSSQAQRTAVFRSLGLRLTYSGTEALLAIRASLAPGGFDIRGVIEV